MGIRSVLGVSIRGIIDWIAASRLSAELQKRPVHLQLLPTAAAGPVTASIIGKSAYENSKPHFHRHGRR